MWFNRELFQRLERLKAQHIENSEFTAKELNSVRKRILTLEKQVVDAMNREEEWKRRLAKIEARLIVDQMKVDGGWKEEEEDWTQLPRVGDLVVNIEHENDIRRVFENHYGFMFVGKEFRTIYAREQLKDSLKEWKVIARKGDLK